jgi:hypothetical protein
MSMMVAEKLDKLQKQYISSNSTKRLSAVPITSMGFSNIPGSNSVHNGPNQASSSIGFARRPNNNGLVAGGSTSGLTLNPDINDLDPIMKGNWMHQRDSSLE